MMSIDELNQNFGSANIEFKLGHGGWPYAVLTHADRSQITVSLYGGHLLSWIQSDGKEIFFLSERTAYEEGKAIRGGIPIIFPWFGSIPNQPKAHGFARSSMWSVSSTSSAAMCPSVTLTLQDTEHTRAVWPYAFCFDLTYRLEDALIAHIKILNRSTQTLTAQCALHSYFAIDHIDTVKVSGLENYAFIDKTKESFPLTKSTDAALMFHGLVDRIYPSVHGAVSIISPPTLLTINSTMPDFVTWNPGSIESAKLSDLSTDGFQKFVCVETGAIQNFIALEPGQHWQGEQRISTSCSV